MHTLTHTKFWHIFGMQKNAKIFFTVLRISIWKKILWGRVSHYRFSISRLIWMNCLHRPGTLFTSGRQATNTRPHSTFKLRIKITHPTGVQKWHEFLISTNSNAKELSYAPFSHNLPAWQNPSACSFSYLGSIEWKCEKRLAKHIRHTHAEKNNYFQAKQTGKQTHSYLHTYIQTGKLFEISSSSSSKNFYPWVSSFQEIFYSHVKVMMLKSQSWHSCFS